MITKNAAVYTLSLGANPKTQNLGSLGVNLQLQMVNIAFDTQAPGFQMSSTVLTSRTNPNPIYGMPLIRKNTLPLSD